MDYGINRDMGFQEIEGKEFSIDALVKEFSGMSKDDIYSEGTRCSSELLDFLMNNARDAASAYTDIMLTCARVACSADGRFDEEERALALHLLEPIREVMGEDIEKIVDKPVDEERMELMRKKCEAFADMGDEGRDFAKNQARLMMCFVAVDGRIDSSEFNMIEKMFKEVFDKLGTYSLFAAMGIDL